MIDEHIETYTSLTPNSGVLLRFIASIGATVTNVCALLCIILGGQVDVEEGFLASDEVGHSTKMRTRTTLDRDVCTIRTSVAAAASPYIKPEMTL
eukprot:4048284-Amphidinium_carterae.1